MTELENRQMSESMEHSQFLQEFTENSLKSTLEVNEKMYGLIFGGGAADDDCGGGVPENLQNDPELPRYLAKLGNSKVEHLKKEQNRLKEEQKAVVEQTQDLAVTNYKTFIQTAERSKQIFKDFEDTEKQVTDVIEKIPSAEGNCREFLVKSSEIIEKRRLNALTLKKNAQLLEILQLPNLMEQCVEQEKYDEALELASYVNRMGQKQGHIPIIKKIAQIIETYWHKMLVKLLDQLKTDLQLPKCLQVIGYLRRMQAFENKELKLKYLQAREAYLNKCLADIPKDDAQHHLTKTIEMTRVNLFNTVTQYKAIFPDEDASSAANTVETDGGRIFESWINRKIDHFLQTLEEDLHKGVSSMDAVLGQCMYFGQSFSRIGADFRGLMVPIFLKVISKKFTDAVTKTNQTFRANLEKYTLVHKVTLHSRPQDQVDQLSPPETLLDFHPLASLCNGYLEALNELRVCAPLSLVFHITKTLQSGLEFVAQQIFYFYRTEKQKLYGSEKKNFIKFASSFAYDLVPYMQKCVNAIFGQEQIASQLGINLTTLQSESIGIIKQKLVLEPLKELLPNKVDILFKAQQESAASVGNNLVAS